MGRRQPWCCLSGSQVPSVQSHRRWPPGKRSRCRSFSPTNSPSPGHRDHAARTARVSGSVARVAPCFRLGHRGPGRAGRGRGSWVPWPTRPLPPPAARSPPPPSSMVNSSRLPGSRVWAEPSGHSQSTARALWPVPGNPTCAMVLVTQGRGRAGILRGWLPRCESLRGPGVTAGPHAGHQTLGVCSARCPAGGQQVPAASCGEPGACGWRCPALAVLGIRVPHHLFLEFYTIF